MAFGNSASNRMIIDFLRAVRVTNFEKLDSAELRELSEEILIQRKV